MWFLKKRDDSDERISALYHHVVNSFSSARQDMQKMMQWMQWLYQRDLEREYQVKQIQMELSYLPKKQIRQLIDEHYSMKDFQKRLDELNSRLVELEKSEHTRPEKIHSMKEKIRVLEDKRLDVKSRVREKLLKQITRNSKDYIKRLILSLIQKYERISAMQLKEIIMHEQGLCSKSSFYRILQEIEQSEQVVMLREGKEKSYFFKKLVVK